MAAAAMTLIVACDPVPRRELTAEEKQADMMWLYSKFGANYAPLEYKQQLHNFDYETLKKTYLEAAAQTPDNEAFYELVQQFVAEFKDAHTSVSFTASGKPGREKVAYLGFSGRREGAKFVVTELFPTIKAEQTFFPIKVGTIITKINGIPLAQYIKDTMTRTTNLGQEDSNTTALMNRIFTRLNIQSPLPKDKDVVLTIVDAESEDGGEIDVTLPWIYKDLYSFRKDMSAAQAEKNAEAEKKKTEGTETLISVSDTQQIPFSFTSFNGSAFDLDRFMKKPTAMSFLERVASARFDGDIAGWTTQVEKLKFATPKDKLAARRVIPEGAMMIEESTVFPAYIAPVEIEGKIVPMGYFLVDSFSVESPMEGFKAALVKMQKFGVQDIVIDTVNNGGGSLILLMELAQALSNKPVVMPKMQIGLNEGWIDSIEGAVAEAPSDAEKALYARLLNEMLAYKAQGLRITPKESAYPVDTITPFYIKPNKQLKKDFNIVLLVNEMCASACDIFAGVLQDNKMATLVGSRTMGAGGNVVNYWQAPNTNMDIRQTESLLVRANGDYIENVGVTPEVKMVVSESAGALYEPLRLKAVEILSAKYKKPVPAPSIR
jgi:C-terminal processing protease CtpA/Prc